MEVSMVLGMLEVVQAMSAVNLLEIQMLGMLRLQLLDPVWIVLGLPGEIRRV